MIINYIYIYDKNTNKKFELNLNHEYSYSFNYSKRVFEINNNERFVEGIYDSGIDNINAIVGKNGTGKTTVIKQILKILLEGDTNNLDYFLYVDDEFEKQNIFISDLKEIYINNISHKPKDIKKVLKNTNVFYYSNVFDGNNIFETKENIINLSTNFLLKKYLEVNKDFEKFRENENHEHIEFVILYKEILELEKYLPLPHEILVKLDYDDVIVQQDYIKKYFEGRGIKVRGENSFKDDREYQKELIETSLIFQFIIWIQELINLLSVNNDSFYSKEDYLNQFNDFWNKSSVYLEDLKPKEEVEEVFSEYEELKELLLQEIIYFTDIYSKNISVSIKEFNKSLIRILDNYYIEYDENILILEAFKEIVFPNLNESENIEKYFEQFWMKISGNLEYLQENITQTINFNNPTNEFLDLKNEIKEEFIFIIDVNFNKDDVITDGIINILSEILKKYNISNSDMENILDIFKKVFFKKNYDSSVFIKEDLEFLETIVYDLEGDFNTLRQDFFDSFKVTLEDIGINFNIVEELKNKLLNLFIENIDILEYRKDITREIELKNSSLEFNEYIDNMEFSKVWNDESVYFFDNSESQINELEEKADEEILMEIEKQLVEHDVNYELGLTKEKLKDFLEQLIDEKIESTIGRIKAAKSVIDSIGKNNTISIRNKALKNYLNKFDAKGIFVFNWRNLSSGEISFIGFLSRLFKAKKMLSKNKDIILFIDEGELYFHPQWQKNYINLLVKSLKGIFKNKRLQVILTSHSPFIVADLPDYSIQVLGGNGVANLLTELGLNKTFAANIHDLYTNAFFIKGGLTGEFAKEKVNEWIERILDNNGTAYYEYEYYLKAFNLIGEPIVREKCLLMLEQKRIEYATKLDKGKKQKLIEQYKELIFRLENEDYEAD